MSGFNIDMNITLDKTLSLNFTGRCPQVRDAQWVCHTVTSKLPHISSTKASFLCDDVLERGLVDTKFAKELEKWHNGLWNKVKMARKIYARDWNSPYNVALMNILQLRKQKLGNCSENARTAEIILKMNGVKKACCAGLRANLNDLDHEVCAFNIDDSPVRRISLKKTIIIDPWLGMADFASNMFVKYKNVFYKQFKIPQNAKLGLTDFDELDFIYQDIYDLKKLFPQLIFKSKNRKFMQKK